MTNLRELTKVAQKLDEVGLIKEADFLDYVIRKLAIDGDKKDKEDFINSLGAQDFDEAKTIFYNTVNMKLSDWIFTNDRSNSGLYATDRGYDYSKAIDAFPIAKFKVERGDVLLPEPEEVAPNAQLSPPSQSSTTPDPRKPTNANWNSFEKSVNKNHGGVGTIIKESWISMAPKFSLDNSFNSFDDFYKWLSKKEGRAVTPKELSDKQYLEYNMAMYSRSRNPMLSNIFPGASDELNMPTQEEYFKSKEKESALRKKIVDGGFPNRIKTKSGKEYSTYEAVVAAAKRNGMNINDLDSMDIGNLLDQVVEGDFVL